jgi:hypothetical protein
MDLYIVTFTFLDSRQEDKTLDRILAIPEFRLHLISLMQFWSEKCYSQTFKLRHTFKRPIHYLYTVLLSCLLTMEYTLKKFFSGFTSRQTSLLVSNIAFLCMVQKSQKKLIQHGKVSCTNLYILFKLLFCLILCTETMPNFEVMLGQTLNHIAQNPKNYMQFV